MRKIDRPALAFSYYEGDDWIRRQELDQWFDEHVEPINKMLDEASVVYSYRNDSKEGCWFTDFEQKKDRYKSKALLINIEPIKQRTREESLTDCIEELISMIENWSEISEQRTEDVVRDAKALIKALEGSDEV